MEAEDKMSQITEQVKAIEGEALTEDIEYAIITDQHITYPLNGKELRIVPMSIRRYQEMLAFESDLRGEKDGSVMLTRQAEFIAKETGEDVVFLLDNLTNDDIGKIFSLMMYGWLEGRRVLKKKSVLFSQVSARLHLLRTVGV